MTRVQFCGPGGKMPPDTAGKDARRYRTVAVSGRSGSQSQEAQALATGWKIVETFGRVPGIFFMGVLSSCAQP
jgi:hypothetical protein